MYEERKELDELIHLSRKPRYVTAVIFKGLPKTFNGGRSQH